MPFGVTDFEEASPASGSFSEDDFVDLPQAKPPGVLSQLGQSLLPGNILNNLVAPAAVGAYNAIGQGFINAPASLYKHIMGQPTEERILGVPGVHSTLPFKPVQQGVPITDIRIPDADVNPISAAMQTMVNGATTPENLMLGVASGGEGMLAKAGRGLFLPPLAEGVVQGAKTALDSSLSPNERIQGGVEGLGSGLMTHGLVHSLGPKVTGFTAADFEAPKPKMFDSIIGSNLKTAEPQPVKQPRSDLLAAANIVDTAAARVSAAGDMPSSTVAEGIGSVKIALAKVREQLDAVRERQKTAGQAPSKAADEAYVRANDAITAAAFEIGATDNLAFGTINHEQQLAKVVQRLAEASSAVRQYHTVHSSSSDEQVNKPQTGSIGSGIKQALEKNQESGMVNLGKTSEGGLSEGVKKVQEIEKENRGDFALTGTRFLLDPKESGFSNSEKPIDAQHVWNRLANKLKAVAPDELAYYESQGLDKEIVAKGKISPQEVATTLAEKGPKVETKILKSGADNNDPIAQGYATLRHEFYDNLPNDAQAEMDRVVSGAVDVEDWIAKHGSPDRDGYIDDAFGDAAKNYADFAYKIKDRPEAGVEGQKFDPDVYRRVAPKDKDQTVVMVKVPVAGERAKFVDPDIDDGILHRGGHFGPEDRNLLGWARGQWEEVKDKVTGTVKKIFHVIEVQSDWGQEVRDQTKKFEGILAEGGSDRRANDALKTKWDPLLDHYQRLTLKAVLDHVKKEGGDGVALSDSATAKLTEGHDQLINAFRKEVKDVNESSGYGATIRQQMVDEINHAWKRSGGEVKLENNKAVVVKEPYGGMDVNYGPTFINKEGKVQQSTLPKILEELTEKKGEKVDFGEHQMAFADTHGTTFEGRRGLQRENLIFKNEDGTPKTTATALHYPIDKVPSQAPSLFEKDKPTSRETKLYGPIPGSFLFDPDFWHGSGKKFQQAMDLASRKTLPTTIRANAEAGNALVRYAISRKGSDLQVVVDTLMKRGLAKDVRTKAKLIQGQEVKSVTFSIKGRRPRTLLVRGDIVPEIRQALQGEERLAKGAIATLVDLNTKFQTKLGVDAFWHGGNILAAVNSATRATMGKSLFGVREISTVHKLITNFSKRFQDSPEGKRQIAQFTKVGAGRNLDSHTDLTSNFLKKFDLAGRLSLNQLYNDLVNAKLEKPTEHGRREFVNQLGQYNSALMNRMQQLLRETGASPFIVAGRNFNSLAMKKLTLSPGVEGASTSARMQMRANNLVGLVSALIVAPVVANMISTGKPTGRKGVPVGAIDLGGTGPDGEPIYFDVAHMYLLRRAARITGIDAVQKGIKSGDEPKAIAGKATWDAVKGVAQPYLGPSVKAVGNLAFAMRETPKRIGEHLGEMAKNINPSVGAAFKGIEATPSTDKKTMVKGASRELLKTFGGALGFKAGPKPAFEDRRNALAQKEFGSDFSKLDFSDQIEVQRKMDETKDIRTDKQREEASIYQVHSEFDRIKEIKSGLSENSRDFVDHHKLQIPNIETSIRKANTTISLDKDKASELTKLTTKYYEEAIQELADSNAFDDANDPSKKRQFEAYMHNAKNKARQDLDLPLLSR